MKAAPSSAKKELHYHSSNKRCVSVSAKGKIKAKAVGKAVIAISADSGVKSKVTVIVKKAPSFVRAKNMKIKKGNAAKVTVNLGKNRASYQIRFTSLRPKTASVSQSGTVKAKKRGTAKIRITAFNGKKCTVKIKIV